MIKVNVLTIWQGKVAIRQGVAEEAISRNEGLIIQHKSETMVIPARNLKVLVAGKSKELFKDYFGKRKPEHLIYFIFRPQVKQESLLPTTK